MHFQSFFYEKQSIEKKWLPDSKFEMLFIQIKEPYTEREYSVYLDVLNEPCGNTDS